MVDLSYRKAMTVVDLDLTGLDRTVPLPDNFLKARLLEHKVGEVYFPCMYYNRFDTTAGSNTATSATVGDYYRFAYSFLGDDIILEPTPLNDETDSLRLTYFFEPEILEDDADEPDFPSIYHRVLVLDSVIQAKGKEEMIAGVGADTDPFIREYQDLYNKFVDNISSQSSQRTFSEPFGAF